MTTCYFHIGLHKTGTSALQRSFHINREYLRQHGVFYGNTAHFEAHHNIAAQVPKWVIDDETPNKFGKLIDSYDQMRRDAGDLDVIISSEMFIERDVVNSVRLLKEAFETVKIIIYLRRQDLLLESVYNQVVKQNGEHAAINEGEYYFTDFLALLDRISKVAPDSDIIVRPYEKQKFVDGNILSDFFSLIDFSGSVSDMEPAKLVNPSLNIMAVEVFRRANQLGVKNLGPIAGLVNETVADVYPERSGPMVGHYLAEQRRQQILNSTRESNAEILRRFCGSQWESLFEMPDKIEPSKRMDISGDEFSLIMASLASKQMLQRNQAAADT